MVSTDMRLKTIEEGKKEERDLLILKGNSHSAKESPNRVRTVENKDRILGSAPVAARCQRTGRVPSLKTVTGREERSGQRADRKTKADVLDAETQCSDPLSTISLNLFLLRAISCTIKSPVANSLLIS